MGLPPTRYLLWKGSQGQAALPMKICVHCCFSRRSLPFIRLLKYGLETFTSWRVRVHEGEHSLFQHFISFLLLWSITKLSTNVIIGSHEECRSALMAVGIPGFALPLTQDGELTREYHLDWLKKRRLSEEADSDEGQHVIVPKALDVLFGRGRRSQDNYGNIRLNQRLEENLDRYNKLKKRN